MQIDEQKKIFELALQLKNNIKDEEIYLQIKDFFSKYILYTVKKYAYKDSNIEQLVESANQCILDAIINYRFTNFDSLDMLIKRIVRKNVMNEVVLHNTSYIPEHIKEKNKNINNL